MNFFQNKKILIDLIDNKQPNYSTNSFRGSHKENLKQKLKETNQYNINNKPLLIFEKQEKGEIQENKINQPKLLTSKLPSAFTLNNRKQNDNLFLKNSEGHNISRPNLDSLDHNEKYLTEDNSPKISNQVEERRSHKVGSFNKKDISRNSSKSTKSDPKSLSQGQSDNEIVEKPKTKLGYEVKNKYLSPENFSNELEKLVGEYSSNESYKKKYLNTQKLFHPKIHQQFKENFDNYPNFNTQNKNEHDIIEGDMNYLEFGKDDYSYKLEDCISLSSKNSGKKVFYVPKFEIFIANEYLISSEMMKPKMKSKIQNYIDKSFKSKRLIKIFQEFRNSPEGFITFLTEYIDGCSIDDLIECNGNLNETLINLISNQLVDCIDEYYKVFDTYYGPICFCDLNFTKKGFLKINSNFSKNLSSGFNDLKINCSKRIHLNLIKYLSNNFPSEYSKNNFLLETNNEFSSSDQLFCIGFILIEIALGKLKFPIDEKAIYDEFKSNRHCCYLHLLLEIDSKNNSKLKIKDFLNEKNFSKKFFDFICLLTCFDRNKNKDFSLKKIKNHIWLKEIPKSRVNIQLPELIKMTKEWKKSENIFSSKKLQNFENSLNLIISKYSENPNILSTGIIKSIQDDVNLFLSSKKKVIKEISFEFGIQPSVLLQKICEILSNF